MEQKSLHKVLISECHTDEVILLTTHLLFIVHLWTSSSSNISGDFAHWIPH